MKWRSPASRTLTSEWRIHLFIPLALSSLWSMKGWSMKSRILHSNSYCMRGEDKMNTCAPLAFSSIFRQEAAEISANRSVIPARFSAAKISKLQGRICCQTTYWTLTRSSHRIHSKLSRFSATTPFPRREQPVDPVSAAVSNHLVSWIQRMTPKITLLKKVLRKKLRSNNLTWTKSLLSSDPFTNRKRLTRRRMRAFIFRTLSTKKFSHFYNDCRERVGKGGIKHNSVSGTNHAKLCIQWKSTQKKRWLGQIRFVSKTFQNAIDFLYFIIFRKKSRMIAARPTINTLFMRVKVIWYIVVNAYSSLRILEQHNYADSRNIANVRFRMTTLHFWPFRFVQICKKKDSIKLERYSSYSGISNTCNC